MQSPTQNVHTVYTIYDRKGTRLYIGYTGRGVRRVREHIREKEWIHEASHASFEHYGSEEEAREIEERSIRLHRPRYNVVHNIGEPKTNPPKTKPVTMRDWYTVSEAASALGVSRQEIEYRALNGDLPAFHASEGWAIPKTILDDWLEGGGQIFGEMRRISRYWARRCRREAEDRQRKRGRRVAEAVNQALTLDSPDPPEEREEIENAVESPMGDGFLTVNEVAFSLGLSEKMVRRLLLDGKTTLPCSFDDRGGIWVSRSDYEAWISRGGDTVVRL